MKPNEPNPDDLRQLEEIQGVDDLLDVWQDSEPILDQLPSDFCHHRRFNIDANSRRVYCRDCDQEVDAFTALTVVAAEWSFYKSGLKRMRRQKEELSARIEVLKRDERNTKARLARAKSKEG